MPNTDLKERVTGLEQFMMELAYETTKTSMAVRQLSQEMKDFKDEISKDTKAFKEEMKDFKDEISKDTKAFKEEMKNFKDEISKDTKAFKEEMKNFKDDMRKDTKAFKEEMRKDTKIFKDEIRKDTENFKKELNKKWGELANKMGTIVEDIVAPGLKGIAAEYFGIKEFDFFAPRLRLKNSDRSMTREFDVIAETNDYFFVVETKSTPSTGFISDFIKLIPQLDSWFPVIREKKLIPVFASLYISDDLITYLTRNNILAMATRGDGMDICNTEVLKAFGVTHVSGNNGNV